MGFQDGTAPRAPRVTLALGALTAIAAAAILAPAGAGASVTCSATALRAGTVSAPTANAAGDPCRKGHAGTNEGTSADTVRILGAATTATGTSGTASSDVLRLDDSGTSGPTAVRLLGSDAYVSCVSGKPVVVGGSSPASVQTTAQTGSIFAPQTPVTVPGLVYVNETEKGAHGTTYRALRVGPENGGIVAGESSAGYTGNPC
jgi:hypothetical protein